MFALPRLPSFLAILLSFFAACSPARAAGVSSPTDPAVLKAHAWDQDVVIGAGAYRGTKVWSKNKPHHKILPGALIEKTEFGTDGSAAWDIEGALLRNCRFHGDLGFHLEAKNTGFEECVFHKSGGWFVQWAGTKWRFENCVFTRSFMPGGLGVNDYSVRAEGCTFVGVKMPSFGLKGENPAKGVQGKDLQFVRCKFVGCDIPETMLALTVDCAFENCQFDAKKGNWEKAEGQVSVKAYVVSGRVPPSYVNSKLSVTFVSGPPPQLAGAQLEHTLAGARILTPWAQQFRTSAELGTVKKLASEIPVFAGAPTASAPKPAAMPAAPAPAAPSAVAAGHQPATPAATGGTGSNFAFFNLPNPNPAPAPATAPVSAPVAPAVTAPPAPSRPAVREVRALDELLLPVPLGQELISGGRVNPAALEAANSAVDQAAAGKPVVLRVPFDALVAHRADGYAFKLRGQPQPLTLRGQAVAGRVEVLFRGDQAATLSRLGKGSVVAVRGVVNKAELTAEGRAVTFTVVITDGTVQ